MKKIKQSLSVWLRAFKIWQKLGNGIWVQPANEKTKEKKVFFSGAFDSIPFLNDDAKRTFVHLLFRPGYMIRDYIGGKCDIYLAPLTSLIIFYSFLALLSPLINVETNHNTDNEIEINIANDGGRIAAYSNHPDNAVNRGDTVIENKMQRVIDNIYLGWSLLHLDQKRELVDTPWKARLAAFENSLRNQGIPMFIGYFLLLWLAIYAGLSRKYGIKLAASATVSAYVLCQICFFKLFVMLFTLGRSIDVGFVLTFLILTVDYHQLLGVSYKRSCLLTIKTGVLYLSAFVLFIILLLAVAAIISK